MFQQKPQKAIIFPYVKKQHYSFFCLLNLQYFMNSTDLRPTTRWIQVWTMHRSNERVKHSVLQQMMPFKLEKQPYYFPFIYFKISTIFCKYHSCRSKKLALIYKDFLGKGVDAGGWPIHIGQKAKPLNPAYTNHVSGIKEKGQDFSMFFSQLSPTFPNIEKTYHRRHLQNV